MHRFVAKLGASRVAEAEAKSVSEPNPATIAATVVEYLERTTKIDASTGVAPLYDAIEEARRLANVTPTVIRSPA
jgi:hypothetical protein